LPRCALQLKRPAKAVRAISSGDEKTCWKA
jgi:hypothetical protein